MYSEQYGKVVLILNAPSVCWAGPSLGNSEARSSVDDGRQETDCVNDGVVQTAQLLYWADELSIVNDGGAELESGLPTELLGGGQHFDDVEIDDMGSRVSHVRQRLVKVVEDGDFHRTVVSKQRQKK